jgi:hypothetical protein
LFFMIAAFAKEESASTIEGCDGVDRILRREPRLFDMRTTKSIAEMDCSKM